MSGTYFHCLLCFVKQYWIIQRHQCCSLSCGCGRKSEVTVHFAIHMSFSNALSPLSNVNKRKILTAKAANDSITSKSSRHTLPGSSFNINFWEKNHQCPLNRRKYNGNTDPALVMNAYRWSRGTAPLILMPNLGIRWRWVVSFTIWLLYPRKESRYPLSAWLCGSCLIKLDVNLQVNVIMCALHTFYISGKHIADQLKIWWWWWWWW
jgi:hypothetical protein